MCKTPLFIKLFLLILCCFNLLTSQAQNKKVPIAFSFAVPDTDAHIDVDIYREFVKKARSMNTVKAGIYNQIPIVIQPKIVIVKDMLAGEIEEVRVVKLQFELQAQNSDGSIVFHRYKEAVIATESTSEKAILKAIHQIKDDNARLIGFFNETSIKVFDFYQDACADLVTQSTTMIERNQYDKAWNALKHIPPSVSCFKEVDKMITSIYLKRKDEHCRKILEMAYKEEEKKDDKMALHYLKFIDPKSDCEKEVLALTAKINKRIEASQQEHFQAQRTNFQQLTETEKVQQLRADKMIIILLNES